MASQAKSDYYEILGVSRAAAGAEIKSSFQNLAAQFHASGRPKNIEDVEEIRSVVTAYGVLSDPAKRQEYDRHGYVLNKPICRWSDDINMHASHTRFWFRVGEDLGADLIDFIDQ